MRILNFLRLCFCVCFIVSFTNAQITSEKFSPLSNHLVKSMAPRGPNSQDKLMNQLLVILKEVNDRDNELRNQIGNLTKELSELSRSNADLKRSVFVTQPHVYNRFFYEYHKKVPNCRCTLENEHPVSFPLPRYPFSAAVKLSTRNDTYYVSLAFERVNGSADTNISLIPAVHYTVIDYYSNSLVRQVNYIFGQRLQYDVFNYELPIVERGKVGNGSFIVDVHVEPPSVTRHGYSHDGSLTWSIEDFRKKRDLEKKRFVRYQSSPYFYTSPKGYRLQVRTWLNGVGGKGLSMAVMFLTGPYDKDLDGAFKHEASVTLFHPTDPTKHLMKREVNDLKDKKQYSMYIGTHKEMDQFLDEEGTLYYQVRILPA